MSDAANRFEVRKFVIGGVATAIVLIYMVRLFTLQLWSDGNDLNETLCCLLELAEKIVVRLLQ